MGNAGGSTQLSGSLRTSESVRRGGKLTTVLAVVGVLIAVIAGAWLVVPGLMNDKVQPKGEETPAAKTEPKAEEKPVPVENAIPAAGAPLPTPAVPAFAPAPADELPVGFGPGPAVPDAAPAASAPEPAKLDVGPSASDILNQGLASRPPDEPAPAPDPAPSVAASVPATPEPAKPAKPKATPAKSETPKATTPAKTEPAADKPKESTTNNSTSTTAPANSGWTEVSTESHKIK
jgi:hypothetical protein